VLRDASGAFVGRVLFASTHDTTTVLVTATLPAGMDGIHGFHVHANDNPANGDGCVADPAQPANTHFVSADGHYNPGGGTHGDHAGDMPALFFTEQGKAAMSFITDRFEPAELKGRAVILHAGADNYGNVPVGTAANQYTPNSPEATTLTANTGNAGNRIACGVVR
jgi:Cu-Zn family superoxide dismutase